MGKIKKVIGISICCVLITSCAFAAKRKGGFLGYGSFWDRGNKVVSIATAKEMRNRNDVILEGHIIDRYGDDRYTLRDSTGSITLEIKDRDWHGTEVGSKDLVRVYGVMKQRKKFKLRVDVDHIDLIERYPNPDE